MPPSTTITTITAAPLYYPDIVYAKWRGRITHQPLQHDLPSYTDYYYVTICPELPLAVGRVIKICALSMETHTSPDHPTHPVQYSIYDPQIEGRILRVRLVEGNMVEFVLENYIKDSAVTLAYVAIPYLPNVTVKLDMVGRLFKWLTKNQPHGGLIQLESAVIVQTITEFSLCPERKTASIPNSECSDEQSDENAVWEEEWEDSEDTDSERTACNEGAALRFATLFLGPLM